MRLVDRAFGLIAADYSSKTMLQVLETAKKHSQKMRVATVHADVVQQVVCFVKETIQALKSTADAEGGAQKLQSALYDALQMHKASEELLFQLCK